MTVPENSRASSDELAEKIRARADSQQAVETTLATSERIIARVTDGIYREPWAAFRELIVNAYDADASYVVIDTGQPDFRHMTVRDDGIGMSPDALAHVINNIGGSSKRTPIGAELNTVRSDALDLSPNGRPLIGKIGIGIFAVAQLTQHFQIITKARGELYRLSATVCLNTHDEEKMQRSENAYIAGSVTIVSQRVPDDEIDSHGTSVVLYQLREEVRRTLQSTQLWDVAVVNTGEDEAPRRSPQYHIGHSSSQVSRDPNLPWKSSDKPEEKFQKFFKATGFATGKGTNFANLDHFDNYLRLIWKLSLSLPLEYIAGHPFDLGKSDGVLFLCIPSTGQADQITLPESESIRKHLGLRAGRERQQDRFSVTLDGIAIRRPIQLPSTLVKESRVGTPVMIVARQDNLFSDDLDLAGGRLSFEAYLYWNSKIIPKETAGVLIRIRDASGTLFDPTFLNYQVSEQNRLRQITAEIFVHEGLDGAINIDRESFNYSHPHFLFIQGWLHRALRLLANRLKALASEDLNQAKKKQRNEALKYATMVWNRRLGVHVDPPFVDVPVGTLPPEIGGVDLEWPSAKIMTAKNKPVTSAQVAALAAILEAYGVLSRLSVEERGQLIEDIVKLPETRP